MKNFWIPWARKTLPTTTRKIVKAQDWFEALLIEISADSVFPAGRLPDIPENIQRAADRPSGDECCKLHLYGRQAGGLPLLLQSALTSADALIPWLGCSS